MMECPNCTKAVSKVFCKTCNKEQPSRHKTFHNERIISNEYTCGVECLVCNQHAHSLNVLICSVESPETAIAAVQRYLDIIKDKNRYPQPPEIIVQIEPRNVSN